MRALEVDGLVSSSPACTLAVVLGSLEDSEGGQSWQGVPGAGRGSCRNSFLHAQQSLVSFCHEGTVGNCCLAVDAVDVING